jgi:antitoxin CptB
MNNPPTFLTESEINQLKWRCRRGLLENDLFIARFFERYESSINQEQALALLRLMDFSDNDLLDMLLQRPENVSVKLDDTMKEVLQMLQSTKIVPCSH